MNTIRLLACLMLSVALIGCEQAAEQPTETPATETPATQPAETPATQAEAAMEEAEDQVEGMTDEQQ
jgi:hypothetical protein